MHVENELDRPVLPAIDGQVAIVTGGAAGIGAATARRQVDPLMPADGASEAALNHLSQPAAATSGEHGIATTILHPGNVEGAMWPGLAEQLASAEGRTVQKILDERTSSVPTGRLQRPDEVARSVIFIAGYQGMD